MGCKWKMVPTAGIRDPEKDWLKDTAARIVERFGDEVLMVTIGVYQGASMHCLRAGAPKAELFGIDIQDFPLFAPDALKAEVVVADSTTYEFDRPIHFLFVDGSHKYEDVARDIELWVPQIVVGGEVAFHDYKGHWHGVAQAVDKWRADTSEDWVFVAGVVSLIAFERTR
jgi:hypothetical protein